MIGFYTSMIDAPEDKDYFEVLYHRCCDSMFQIACGILHKEDEAEDAVYQAFLTIANNFKKIRQIPRQQIDAYIAILTKNVSINMLHSNQRKTTHCVELDDDIPDVEIDFLESFAHEELVKAIGMLPQIYKDIVYLYYLEEFSAKEISKMLGISENTVWKRAERAKKLLKKSLERGFEYAEN